MTSSEVPETDLARIRRWCAARVPSEAAHQVRVVGLVDGPRVVITEERPPWDREATAPWETYPLARLTYVATTRHWKLEVSAEGDRFRKYARRPSGALEGLLEEIDADPTFVFWG